MPASSKEPYISLSIELDWYMLRGLMYESRIFVPLDYRHTIHVRADAEILRAWLRLVNLVSDPELFFCISPLIVREIHYRMLIGPLGTTSRYPIATYRRTGQVYSGSA